MSSLFIAEFFCRIGMNKSYPRSSSSLNTGMIIFGVSVNE